MFVNREKELGVLTKRIKPKNSELLIMYGRRRVGKTELIRNFIKHKPSIYYMADRRVESEQLALYSKLLGEHFSDPVIIKQPLKDWDLVFSYLTQKLNKKDYLVLVFDEFPYLVEVNPALPSILQRHWDQSIKSMNISIILCGSSMSFMEKELLSYKSPLYGRRTGQMEILPFSIREVHQMFPSTPPERLVEIYSFLGGIPAYLQLYNKNISLWRNIEEKVFPVDEFLHNEVQFLLMEELRYPHNYFAILRSLAFGKTKVNDIVQLTGLERGMVGKYLDHMMDLRIVKRSVPVTENPVKSRKGLYSIDDNYFRFWFKYIYPNRTYLEEGRYKKVLGDIKRDFASFVGPVFENIARVYLKSNGMPDGRILTNVGSWWHKDKEIDIVAFDEDGNIVVGECKWSNKKVGTNIYNHLKEKSSYIGIRNKSISYIIFSKRGFTDELHRITDVENIHLISLDEMI